MWALEYGGWEVEWGRYVGECCSGVRNVSCGEC